MRSDRFCAAAVVGLAILAGADARATADPWIEVKSPNFTVVSNGTESRARNIAWQFEQIRASIQRGWPWARAPLDRPLVIFAARNEATMKSLAPKYWEPNQLPVASVYGSSAVRHYIALRADLEVSESDGANPYRYSYWAYSGLMLSSHLQGGRLPLWFTTGFNEVSSNTIVTTKTVQIGKPIRAYVSRLHDRLPFPIARLLAITRESPEYLQADDRHAYDAETWGVMQYVLFGAQASEARETRANQLARLLLNGTPSAAAIEQVFGSVQAFEDNLKLFFRQGLFNYSQMDVDAAITTKGFVMRALSDAESAAVRAGLHVALNRPVEARTELAAARAGGQRLGTAAEVDAILLDREGKLDEARQAFATAADLGSDSSYVSYRAASLAWRPNADAATVESVRRWLARSIELNPRYAPAHNLLTNVLLQGNQLDAALEAADRALGLDPRRSALRVNRAVILLRLNRRDEAIAEARVAVAMAETDAERRQAESLLASLERTAPPAN